MNLRNDIILRHRISLLPDGISRNGLMTAVAGSNLNFLASLSYLILLLDRSEAQLLR